MTVIQRDLSGYAKETYKDYALYVLLDRALARFSDGLKPVQRRILYAMYELHLNPHSKPKKSVRVIGDALGKYHPHSDQAGYEALVALAQDFSIRYPLIEGQGNFGSIDDPKSFASMRYTEVRLSGCAPLLFDELSAESVTWQQNFDGTLKEPIELPSQVPLLLLNGCSGIAVGLSTEIPPHHLGECLDALVHYLKHPTASLETLLRYMPGPDFPTGGILRASAEDLKTFYQYGKGSFSIEAKIVQESSSLVIREIPYTTTSSKIIEQLQVLNQTKIWTAPFDLIDESDEKQPVRIVLTFKTAGAAKAAWPIILEKTDCCISYRAYFNALDEKGIPKCFDLKEFFRQWVEYRQNSLLLQLQARQLAVAERRAVLHVYKIGFHSLDKIFDALKKEDDPWAFLKVQLKMSDEEMAILSSLRLKELSKLSLEKIYAEEKSLIEENAVLVDRILHREKRILLIIDQLKKIKVQHADRRRTEIADPSEKPVSKIIENAFDKEPAKPVWILLTQLGWIKIIRPSKTGAPIDFTSHCRQGDSVMATLEASDQEPLVFIDHKGRFYSLLSSDLPVSKYGEHISNFLNIPSGNQIVLMTKNEGTIALATRSGYGFALKLEEHSSNKRGKQVVKMDDSDVIQWVNTISANQALWIRSEADQGLLPLSLLPSRQSGQGLLLWKADSPVELDLFDLQSNFLAGQTQNGKKLSFDFRSIMIKRGQALKKIDKKFGKIIKSSL